MNEPELLARVYSRSRAIRHRRRAVAASLTVAIAVVVGGLALPSGGQGSMSELRTGPAQEGTGPDHGGGGGGVDGAEGSGGADGRDGAVKLPVPGSSAPLGGAGSSGSPPSPSSAGTAENDARPAVTPSPDAASPRSDGGQLAFSSNRDGDWDIWVQPLAGGEAVNLTADENKDQHQPAWSPDGSRLAYRSTRSPGSEIFVTSSSGGAPRQLTRSSCDCDDALRPVWSPDGERIAYFRIGWFPVCGPASACAPQIRIVDADGTSDRAVVAGASPSWSPDGQRIAYVKVDTASEGACHASLGASGCEGAVHVFDLESGTDVAVGVSAAEVAWSPVSDVLAYQHFDGTRTHIYTVRTDGAEVRRLTPADTVTGQPAWTADGTHLAFARTGPAGSGGQEIWLMRADGSDPRPLTPNGFAYADAEPACSRHG